MVTKRDRWWLAAALAASLGGCSAEFGGRCEVDDDCGETQVCTQGYCLPDDVEAGPDDGVPDDVGPMADGGRIDLEPVSDGAPLDAGGEDLGPDAEIDMAPPPLCPAADGVIPAYDVAQGHRACPDEATVALWRFDGDFDALGPNGEPGPARAGMPRRQAVQLVDEGIGGAARFVGDMGQETRFVLAGEEGLRNETPLSVELWARLDGFDGGDRPLMSSVDISGMNRGGWELFVRRAGEAYIFGAGAANLFSEGERVSFVADDRPFEAGRWVHLAVIARGGINGVSLYIDGERSDREGTAAFGRYDDPFRFGERSAEGGPRYPGLLDEVRVSSVPRSPDDFAAAAANPPE